MKPYSFKTILNKGRFKNYYLSKSLPIQKEIKLNSIKYANKYKEYSSKRNCEFLVNVFFALSAFDVLLNHGLNKEEAYKEISEAMYEYLQKYVKFYSKIFGSSLFYPILKKAIIKKMLAFNKTGWLIKKERKEKEDIYFEVHKCLVNEILKQENKLEIGKMFCNADLILYMNLERTEFIRSETIIKGGRICDMHFKRYKKGVNITRHKSI